MGWSLNHDHHAAPREAGADLSPFGSVLATVIALVLVGSLKEIQFSCLEYTLFSHKLVFFQLLSQQ